MKKLLISLTLPALLFAFSGVTLAQKPVKHESEPVVVKATIEKIDHDTRMITLKEKDGKIRSILAGPEVRRFDELKIGDVVTFHTTESVAYRIRKPGEPAPPSSNDDPAIVRGAGVKPSASKTEQETKVVTVKEVDPKTQGVTIQTEDGRTMSFRVEDKNILKGLKAGDRVVISYTTATVISVE